MHCVFPTCDYDANRAVSLYRFPEEASLRKAWLEALGKADCDLDSDSAVCSKHFLAEDFLVTRSGLKLRLDAVPVVNVQVCRICFDTDCKLYPMKNDLQLDLSRPSYALAYETLTGLSIDNDDMLPQYLCINCANCLLNCVRFRAKSIRAHSILMEVMSDYGYITLDTILAVSRLHNSLNADITYNQTDSELIDSENTCTVEQDLKHEDVTYDGIKTESVEDFAHNILISDIRSNVRISQNSQCNPEVNVIKTQTNDIIIQKNEDVLSYDFATNDNTVCLPSGYENTVNIKTKAKVKAKSNNMVYQNNVNEESNKDNVNKKSNLNNGNIATVFIGKGCSLNESVPLGMTPNKYIVSPTTMKDVMTVTNDMNRMEVNRKWEPKGNGGLLLSYKLLSCDICNYQSVSNVELMRHLKDHAATKLYNCNECYFVTNSKKNLKFHVAAHSNAKQHICDICEKRFTYKNDLKTHMRIHSGEKPYPCDICNKKFSQYNQLKVHLKIHTGEKPYSCNVCVKTFRQKGQLQNHLQIHTGVKSYTCDVCKKGFIQRGQLQRHLQKHS